MKLQCGYEDECKNKDCTKCRKNFETKTITLSEAQRCAIEDLSIIDLQEMFKSGRGKELDLMQSILRKVMVKVFKEIKLWFGYL